MTYFDQLYQKFFEVNCVMRESGHWIKSELSFNLQEC